MRRRGFLHGVSITVFGALGVAPSLAPVAAVALPSSRRVRLGALGDACEAATIVAPRGPEFVRRHIDARIVSFSSEAALVDALAAGTIDAASVKLPALLRPLEAGKRIRLSAGLHSGCLRVLAQDAISLNSLGDLKGKVIAVDRLGGSAMSLLSALLRRQGLDPQRDVAWKVLAPADLEAALDEKAVSSVAAADPLGYDLLTDHKAEAYIDSAGGGFSCGGDIAPGHHCFLALSGQVVERDPELAADLTRAYVATTAAIGRGVGPAAVAEARGPFAADLRTTLGMLSSYDWSPSTDYVLQELELTAGDFRRAGLLERRTDPEALAERGFADVLHA